VKNNIEIEKIRYNKSNKSRTGKIDFTLIGSDAIDNLYRAPYVEFENILKSEIKKDYKVLDLCCGDGIYSIFPLKCGSRLYGVDISEVAIEIASERVKFLGYSNNCEFRVCDVHQLPFENNYFDLVMCVGSLSYVDLSKFMNEISRVLKQDGKMILLDSYDHNILFKINRFFQVITGRRSFSTFSKIPDKKTIYSISKKFSNLEVLYFDRFLWVSFFLKLFLPKSTILKTIRYLENIFDGYDFLSFKIIIKAKNIKNEKNNSIL
jgi:ubiquinone/menaquinone biosynthesis C-methylase UbiE